MTKMLLAGISLMVTLQAYTQTASAVKPAVATESNAVENNTRNLAIVVVSRFNSEMNLNTEQKQKMLEIIGRYLDEKIKIIPLMNANKTEYDEKQASYFKTLRVKLKDVLVRTQLYKFMLLKPKPADIESSLYYVYY